MVAESFFADGQTNTMNLIFAFRSCFVKALKNEKNKCFQNQIRNEEGLTLYLTNSVSSNLKCIVISDGIVFRSYELFLVLLVHHL